MVLALKNLNAIFTITFPAHSVGEVRPMRGLAQRMVRGSAERALLAVLPSEEEFPYTIRVVSEVLSLTVPVP